MKIDKVTRRYIDARLAILSLSTAGQAMFHAADLENIPEGYQDRFREVADKIETLFDAFGAAHADLLEDGDGKS